MNVCVHNLNKIKSRPYNATAAAIVIYCINYSSMKQLFRKPSTVVPELSTPMPSLVMCLLMDFIGYASYTVPFFGEFLDILWAPLSAIIFWKMFGFKKGFFGGIFSFVEELTPGLDFIPTFTINWVLVYFKRNKQAFSLRPFTR